MNMNFSKDTFEVNAQDVISVLQENLEKVQWENVLLRARLRALTPEPESEVPNTNLPE